MSAPSASTLISRLNGSLYGLAVGDALGAPYEFKKRGSYQISLNMEPSSTFLHDGKPLPAGTFTDDTSLALCLAQSLNERRAFVWQDAAEKMTRWFSEGYMSAIGECFDIGHTTSDALGYYRAHLLASRTQDAFQLSGSTVDSAAGNGSLMRLAPIPIFFHSNPPLAIEQSALQSRITHGSSLAVESCQLASVQIIGFLQQSEQASPQEKKERVLAPDFLPIGVDQLSFKTDQVKDLREGTWKHKAEGNISTAGFVIASHEAALWALWKYETFEEGMLQLLTMGSDVDTVCAIYGQLAGACYGIDAIPSRWLRDVRPREMLDQVFGPLIQIAVENKV